ncbi:MAG: histidine kinase [Actinomycetota bacterium]|nr:histidine kinase [Actinomycetota bacterium]
MASDIAPAGPGHAARGHLRVVLGMAAGVGKTVRMLAEGRTERDGGRDVVIGLLETHGRADTAAAAVGLELVPRRVVSYRGTELEEMDLSAILARAPELCLIDELAHTNAPGLEHEKRYDDVEDVLAAGIDVLSTLNVQHLESLNDQVAELSGIRVRETIPDAVLARADEIVVVDLTPEELIERLRAGKVYPLGHVDAALNNFFRIENLSALREVALRQVAQEVGTRRLAAASLAGGRGLVGSRDQTIAREAPSAVSERLLALVEPYPGAQRLVRRAWRSAQRLGSELDLLWVRAPGTISVEQEQSLTALRQLASLLGAHLLVEESDTVAETVAAVARRQGTTYILLGRPRPARGLARLQTPLPLRLLELLPGVDVRIVADRVKRTTEEQR